ncbi:hypothetical protein K9L16_00275 [Candidatus Pacearchaeota archaeon]|nr:hypothetical protein [Candidatus Pacearchaeota archaeon]
MPEQKISSFDFLGNIAVVKFPEDFSERKKKQFAKNLIKSNKAIKTVLEKKGKISGRLRKLELNYLAGEKTQEVLYKENNCVFRFDIGTTYFSPRLSNERKEIAGEIKKGESVFVMFAGVGPYPIVIAKNSQASRVVYNEINRIANKYGKLNIELNNLKNKIEIASGDIKRVVKNFADKKEIFDVIVMPRPQLKETFLQEAFALAKSGKKGTRIYYYDFCNVDEIDEKVNLVKEKAREAGKKIKIFRVKKAGEIAPYKIRLRIDFKVV